MPYVNQLSDVDDFLYATTDVAIWSCLETGIGITASCAATLRPLFKEFFNRSKLLGGTSSKDGVRGTSRWRSGVAGRYIRSGSGARNEDFDLRDDIGAGTGVKTIIDASGSPEDSLDGKDLNRSNSARGRGMWGNSKSRLTETGSEEDFEFGGGDEMGIRKTVVSTRVAEASSKREGGR